MNGALKLAAWTVALALVGLPIVGVLNGWFAADRWPVRALELRAAYEHVDPARVQAAALPLLADGFFAVRLDDVRRAVAEVPWVARVEARKRWPDTLELTVHERKAYARWDGDRLLDPAGEIFSVPDAARLLDLPELAGPDARAAEVRAFYEACRNEFKGSGLVVRGVTLTARGGWRLALDGGAQIELGRDEGGERPQTRLKRFLDVWPELIGAHGGAVERIDLRYENGFALRWAAPVQVPPTRPGTAPADQV